MNITVQGEWIVQATIVFMLVSLRVFGLFLAAPMLSFRAAPPVLRVMIAIVIGLSMLPRMNITQSELGLHPPTFVAAAIEIAIGMTMGFVVRIGLSAMDLAAEILSTQTGLNFASNYVRDPALASGLTSQFLGLAAIALTLIANLHLVLIELVLRSYGVLPFGTWPADWDIYAIVRLVSRSFEFGLVLAMPMIVVQMLFYVVQAVLGRAAPQLNLFSVGFSVSAPLAFFVLALVLPDLPAFVQRILEAPYGLLRHGLETLPAAPPAR